MRRFGNEHLPNTKDELNTKTLLTNWDTCPKLYSFVSHIEGYNSVHEAPLINLSKTTLIVGWFKFVLLGFWLFCCPTSGKALAFHSLALTYISHNMDLFRPDKSNVDNVMDCGRGHFEHTANTRLRVIQGTLVKGHRGPKSKHTHSGPDRHHTEHGNQV